MVCCDIDIRASTNQSNAKRTALGIPDLIAAEVLPDKDAWCHDVVVVDL